MDKVIDELVKRRFGTDDKVEFYGRSMPDSNISDEDYIDICKSFNRLQESEYNKLFESDSTAKKDASLTFVKDRFITFVASDETVDSYGDILRVDGADLSRLKANASAFISSHDVKDISGAAGVIVKAVKAKNVEGSPNGKALLITVYFPTFEEDPDADYIFKKYKARTLNAVSVGLQVLEAYSPEDPSERKRLGLGKYGVEVRRWLPYELSAVTVGANPNALMRRSLISDEDVKRIIKETMLELIENKESNHEQEAKPESKLRCYLDSFDVKVNLNV